MSRPLFSAARRIASMPFAMERGGSVATSIAGSMCLRRASSQAITLQKYNNQVQFVDLPPKFCAKISDISNSLIARKIIIPSPEFISAVAKVREEIEQHDDLAESLQNFENGEYQSIIFEGKFSPTVADVGMVSANVQHIEKEGEESSDEKVLEAINRSLPDLLFATALTRQNITQFDRISSLNSQLPHVDFNPSPATSKDGDDVRINIIFFAGIADNPYPNVATGAIPASEILKYFSDQEIEFLRGVNFVTTSRDIERGVDALSEPFAIIAKKALNYDGSLEKRIEAVKNPDNFNVQELFERITKVSALLLHNNMVPIVVLNDNTKTIMRNYDEELGNVMHFRTEAMPALGEGGTPSYSSDPTKLFRKKVDSSADLVLPNGAQPREIIRIGFSNQKLQFQDDKSVPMNSVSAIEVSGVGNSLSDANKLR